MQQVPSAWGLAGSLVAGRRLGRHSSDMFSSRWCLTQRGECPGGSLFSPSCTSFSGPRCPPLAYRPPVGSPPTVYFSSYRQSPVHMSLQPHREAPLCRGFSSASSKGYMALPNGTGFPGPGGPSWRTTSLQHRRAPLPHPPSCVPLPAISTCSGSPIPQECFPSRPATPKAVPPLCLSGPQGK